MVIPDLIISWPNNCDYPLWRKFLADNRTRFNEVIIAFTETHQEPTYTDFIKDQLAPLHCQFVTPPPTPPNEDWRNIAVNQCLIHSYNAEWIWFTEQDYIITNPQAYFEEITHQAEKGYEVMAHYEADRMHPASIFIKRSLLNRTRKDFGIIPNKYDHFYKLQQDIGALQSPVYHIDGSAFHLNGLSSNLTLIARGEAPNYKPDMVAMWLHECFVCGVPLSKTWRFIYQLWVNRNLPQGKAVIIP